MKINKEGYCIISVYLTTAAAIVAICFCLLPLWLAIAICAIAVVKSAFVVAFFREPARELRQDDQIVYCPCDGKVVVIEDVYEGEYLKTKCKQVSIFMSITNVHVNWYPVAGTVEYFKYHEGKFLVAWHPKSSEENERTTTVVDTGKHKVLFRQIAGFVARRIVSYAKEGEHASQNSKCGFIKFGSRIDLFLPLDSEILISMGDKVVGSQTQIARLK